MSDDLVKRLYISEEGVYQQYGPPIPPPEQRNSVMREAAEAIISLTKERDEARQESLDNYGQGIKRGALLMRERAAQLTATHSKDDLYVIARQLTIADAIRELPLLEESK